VHALMISALTHMVNLENIEMSTRLILLGVIRTYYPDFKYDTTRMTLFRSTLMASNNGAL
jgi:hypothetical protein